MKSKSVGKVRLTSFDDLFGANEMAAGEAVTSVPPQPVTYLQRPSVPGTG